MEKGLGRGGGGKYLVTQSHKGKAMKNANNVGILRIPLRERQRRIFRNIRRRAIFGILYTARNILSVGILEYYIHC